MVRKVKIDSKEKYVWQLIITTNSVSIIDFRVFSSKIKCDYYIEEFATKLDFINEINGEYVNITINNNTQLMYEYNIVDINEDVIAYKVKLYRHII